ncbi:hypothetical protein PG996_005583 [Apiospora saccharicola]|uniref:Uncharacterized protein n=1 Tax=Apiospora saccharicola TaxID=335842 RepID=A0ABR1VLV3_9PEZI
MYHKRPEPFDEAFVHFFPLLFGLESDPGAPHQSFSTPFRLHSQSRHLIPGAQTTTLQESQYLIPISEIHKALTHCCIRPENNLEPAKETTKPAEPSEQVALVTLVVVRAGVARLLLRDGTGDGAGGQALGTCGGSVPGGDRQGLARLLVDLVEGRAELLVDLAQRGPDRLAGFVQHGVDGESGEAADGGGHGQREGGGDEGE